jgi:hypothetical protein
MGDADFLEAIRGNAESCVRYFAEVLEAPPLDYTRASLATVDDFLGALHLGVEPPGQSLENVVQLISCYVYETARREYGGFYIEGNAENPFVLGIPEREPRVIVFVQQKVRGRISNGPEDNIPFFYDGIPGLLATPGVSWLT